MHYLPTRVIKEKGGQQMFDENKILLRKGVSVSVAGRTESATLVRRKKTGECLIIHDYHPLIIPQKDWDKFQIKVLKGGT